MKKLVLDQYPALTNHKRSLVALSNSLLRKFDVEPFHESLEEVDTFLADKKKVALFLFDAAGKSILESHPAGRFFLDHMCTVCQSVNPSTTAAATTSLLSGKFPAETGWIGWSIYMPELKRAIDAFPNRYSDTGEALPLGLEKYMYRRCPYASIFELMQKKGHNAKSLFPWDYPFFEEQIDAASALFQTDSSLEFLYVYILEPDHTMHEEGPASKKVEEILERMVSSISTFVRENPDVATLVVADHGQIAVEWLDLCAVKEIDEVLLAKPFLDARFASFLIKEGKEEAFAKAFRKHFPSFLLLSKEEAIEKHIFGEGEPTAFLQETLGPFVAISTDKKALYASRFEPDGNKMKGHHAGILKEEKEICISCFYGKEIPTF